MKTQKRERKLNSNALLRCSTAEKGSASVFYYFYHHLLGYITKLYGKSGGTRWSLSKSCATPVWYYVFFLYEVLTTENVKNVHFCNRPVVRFALNGPLRSVLLRIYALLTTKNVKCSFLCLGCMILSHDAVRFDAIIVGIRRRESIG